MLAPALLRSIAFRPRLLAHLRNYTWADFGADLAAGATVGIVALPLAMAFGIASGVRPEQGIITAIIAGFLISALGGSRVQIGGPAGAFVALLYAIAEKYGVANLLLATMMAGVMLFAMGAFRFGSLVRFVPVSIVLGFTNGIAVIVAVSQLKDFLGLAIVRAPSNFFSQLSAIASALHSFNWLACAIGLMSLGIILLWPLSYQPQATRFRRILTKLPSTIIVLIISSLLVWLFKLPVETVGSKFGALPAGLPLPAFPHFDWQSAQNLVAPTIAIAFLCAVESLLCARVADELIGDRHDPNQELMAQGIANFFTPFFGGIAATGTIARTVTNVRSGARSPLAGIVHAMVLLLIIVVAAPLASGIPLASLAAILLWVAWSMGDWREFMKLSRFSMFYRTTLLSTFAVTVVFDLVTAIVIGLVMSSMFFIYRVSSVTRVSGIPLPMDLAARGGEVAAYRIFGSLFFASVNKLEALLDPAGSLPKVLILELHQLINLDTTGLDAFRKLHALLLKQGGHLIIAGATEQPLSLMRRGGLAAALGEAQLAVSLDEALQQARRLLVSAAA